MLNKLSQSFNRALIKRVDLLPNVSEFKTHRLGVHEYAAVYGIEKVLRSISVEKLNKGKPNKYLERVAFTLTKYAVNGQVCEYNKLSEITQRKSIAFRVLALNRTIDNWYTIPLKKLAAIWRSLNFICRTNSADLKFKRVWIDKKPGDYARPLGVPTPAWRCWSYMKMDHLERFYKGTGSLQPWQHGGRSGVGVLSCYKQLIPKMIAANTIYEFDIKGFFDNISHEVIINKVKTTLGNKQSDWIAKILKAQPMAYVLPPEKDDKATKIYKEFKERYDTINRLINEVRAEYYEILDSKGKIIWGTSSRMPNFRALRAWSVRYAAVLNEIAYLESNKGVDRYVYDGPKHLVKQLRVLAKIQTGDLFKFMEYPIDLMNKYADLMNTEVITKIRNLNVIAKDVTLNDREKGRDKWKNLGQPGKGVPQGLGTSPFLSTFITDTHLYELGTDQKALIMYMDDGILFAKNKAEMEKLITRLKELLGSIGLEIAPEKSRYVKEEGKWLDSVKFLGLRFLPEENTIMSDTRGGTKVKFPMNADWDDVKTLAVMNGSSISNIKEKYDCLINTTAYEAGLRYGFLGCLIAGSQYKENKSMEERQYDIRKGQNSAWAEITSNSDGFVWKFQDLHNYTEYLTNISSIQVHKFMNLNRKGGKLYQYQGRKHRQELRR